MELASACAVRQRCVFDAVQPVGAPPAADGASAASSAAIQCRDGSRLGLRRRAAGLRQPREFQLDLTLADWYFVRWPSKIPVAVSVLDMYQTNLRSPLFTIH
jgi:hypothetical protein